MWIIEHYQVIQCPYYGNPRSGRREGRRWRQGWGRVRERAENVFKKIMAEMTQIWRETFIQLHGAYRCPNRYNPKKASLRHIIIKLSKIQGKERILTAAREKELVAYRSSHKAINPFLSRKHNGKRWKILLWDQETKQGCPLWVPHATWCWKS